MRWECRERFPRHRLQRKLPVSDPGMYHGTCVTHVPWCMMGSRWRGKRGKTFPAFPAHAQPTILRIWQEGYGMYVCLNILIWLMIFKKSERYVPAWELGMVTVTSPDEGHDFVSRSFCLIILQCNVFMESSNYDAQSLLQGDNETQCVTA